jgi:hypothetical protein
MDGLILLGLFWVLLFPVLTGLLAERWGFGWPVGLITGFLLGPFGPLALWYADRR